MISHTYEDGIKEVSPQGNESLLSFKKDVLLPFHYDES